DDSRKRLFDFVRNGRHELPDERQPGDVSKLRAQRTDFLLGMTKLCHVAAAIEHRPALYRNRLDMDENSSPFAGANRHLTLDVAQLAAAREVVAIEEVFAQ